MLAALTNNPSQPHTQHEVYCCTEHSHSGTRIFFCHLYAVIIFNTWPLRSLQEEIREENHTWEILRGVFLEVAYVTSAHILLARIQSYTAPM